MQFLTEHGNEVCVRIERVEPPEDADYRYGQEWVRITAGTTPYLNGRVSQTVTINDDDMIARAVGTAVTTVLLLYRDRMPAEPVVIPATKLERK